MNVVISILAASAIQFALNLILPQDMERYWVICIAGIGGILCYMLAQWLIL